MFVFGLVAPTTVKCAPARSAAVEGVEAVVWVAVVLCAAVAVAPGGSFTAELFVDCFFVVPPQEARYTVIKASAAKTHSPRPT